MKKITAILLLISLLFCLSACDFADAAMFCLILLDAVPDQNENLAVGGTPLIICDHMELIQHFFVNTNGQILDSHIITP